MKKIFVFPINFVLARIVRILLTVFDVKGPTKVAFISCYRDEIDVSKFGYWNINHTPDVLSWIRYEWMGIKGRLFMIGSITEQLTGIKATEESKEKGRQQFIKAAQKAIGSGAEVILLAAGGTKRLFTKKRLEELFPKTIFSVGDNFTALLLKKRILEAFKLSGLDVKKSKALVIAPYGFLGKISLDCLLEAGCNVVGMGNPFSERRKWFKKFAIKKGFTATYSFDNIGKVDLVVACNSADYAQLTPDRVDKIRKLNRKLTIVDPCEPPAMPYKFWKKCQDKVIRYDAGNGYSPKLKYILGAISYKLLRMTNKVAWGCFCETFIIAKHPDLRSINWFEVSSKNMEIISQFFGKNNDQFYLPPPTCFNKHITDFSRIK